MKRLQALLLLSLASTFLLFGCGKKEEVDEQPAVSQVIEKQPELEETNETAEPAAEEAPTDDEAPPKEGMVRSTLTNEWIEGDLKDARPISIMVPNDSSALPHYNLSKADILYECPVEGNITRSMAVIKDWENLDHIGNVRSCRDYFVYWAFEWDSIYLHFGGPTISMKSSNGKTQTTSPDALMATRELTACMKALSTAPPIRKLPRTLMPARKASTRESIN